MKAIIFDMDGVILNSEPLHIKVCEEILNSFKVNFPKNYFDKYLGVANPIMWAQIKNEFQLIDSVEEIVKLQEEKTFSTIRKINIEEAPNLKKFLEILKANKIPCAIASSSPQELIDIIVEKLELKDFLSFWISAENFNTSKPEPKIFLETAKKLNIETGDIIVIEDSENGIKAAKRAHMKCIAYTKFHIGSPNTKEADLIINDFSELFDIKKLEDL